LRTCIIGFRIYFERFLVPSRPSTLNYDFIDCPAALRASRSPLGETRVSSWIGQLRCATLALRLVELFRSALILGPCFGVSSWIVQLRCAPLVPRLVKLFRSVLFWARVSSRIAQLRCAPALRHVFDQMGLVATCLGVPTLGASLSCRSSLGTSLTKWA
jgi:hypothetical protein